MLFVNYENPEGKKLHNRLLNEGYDSGEVMHYEKQNGEKKHKETFSGEFGEYEFGEYYYLLKSRMQGERMNKLYPDSGVELTPYIAKHYDKLMNGISFGIYSRFISKAIADMDIKPDDSILDLGCGTGRNASLMLQYLGKDVSL
jgi:hypothetical protein